MTETPKDILPEIINGTITCPICSKVFLEHEKTCTSYHCDYVNPHQEIKEAEAKKKEEVLYNEKINRAKQEKDFTTLSNSEIANLATNIVITSSMFVAGKEIEQEIEFITAECVYGMHVFKDLFSGFRDFFGGRSKAVQDTLRDARRTVLTELRREALMVGADAIIAVDLDYQELSGGQKNGMLMLVASGTAVRLK